MDLTAEHARELADFSDKKLAEEELPRVLNMIIAEAHKGEYSLYANYLREQTKAKLMALGYRIHSMKESKCSPRSCFIYWDKK